MLKIHVQADNIFRGMYREKETNRERKKEGTYARLKQSG